MDPDKRKGLQRHGSGNKGFLEDHETRTFLFKKCAIAAAGLLLLPFPSRAAGASVAPSIPRASSGLVLEGLRLGLELGLGSRGTPNRQPLNETDLVSEMKLRGGESCLEEEYELAVQAVGSHLVVAAFPQGRSDCPVAVADSGHTEDVQEVHYTEGVPVLTKHPTLIEPDIVTEEDLESMLVIGNIASLAAFHDAIQSARTIASKDSAYDLVRNNCVTFILDVMTYLKIDFGKKEVQTKLTNFAVRALMVSEHKDAIVANIKKTINNHAVKVWVKIRGDKYVVKKLVKTFLKNYNRKSD